MSHRHTPDKVVQLCTDNQKFTIRQYFGAVICAACGEQTRNDICSNCIAKPDRTTTILYEKLRWLERTHHELTMVQLLVQYARRYYVHDLIVHERKYKYEISF